MDNIQDLLQDRLPRLENGEPLEGCLTGLPPDEAELLRTAALLRAVDYPAPLPAAVAAHRAKVLEAARATKSRSVMPSNAQPRWVLPVSFSAAAALALIVCVVAGLAVAGITWWNGKQIQVAAANPQTAVLAEVRGDVRVQVNDAWERAEAGQTITAGQRIRTGALSSATLIFYDQSRARLGANTEMWVDTLDARTSGPRTIQMTHWGGETDHDVAHSTDPASVYEVRTPSGSGIAKGTKFRVLVVASTLLVRFDVDEGAVAVTHLDVTVIVIAGQSTTIPGGQPPSEPVFRVTGEGEVLQVGDVWSIAGQTFRTDANTVIIGSPEVGDWVAVTGYLLADGTRVADQIILLRRALENRFAFTGKVDFMGTDGWVIAGREILVDEISVIEDGIVVGDTVEVVGGIAQDGALWASEIRLVSEAQAFEFIGVVAEIADAAWTISGIAIATNAETEIGDEIEAGDIVKVEGRILNNGSWLATSIKLAAEDERKFEVSGPVESIDPWKVAGIEFDTGPGTEMDDGIEVGDQVKVEGRVLVDGRWVADEIERLDNASRFEFVGRATSTDPWIVGGVTLSTNDDTEIVGEITVGDFVRVKGKILPDGAWLAEEIERIDNSQGCVDISTVVSNVDLGQVVLLNGQTIDLNDDVQVNGEIKPATVVLIRICATEDGEVVIVSITVVFQLDTVPTTGSGEDDKVTICHKSSGKNPETITVSRSALDAHLGHGDTLGPCQQDNDDD